MRHYSIDLETFGTLPGCAIIQIGIAEFELQTDYVETTLNLRISLNDPDLNMFTADCKTIAWWLEQSQEARTALLGGTRTLRSALEEVTHYFTLAHTDWDFCVWGNGASFDLSILAEAYRVFGMNVPWKFYNERDVRTAKQFLSDFAPDSVPKRPRRGHHIAVVDAEYQANIVQAVYRVCGNEIQ